LNELAKIIGFVRNRKWVLLIPFAVIWLASHSWGLKFLLFVAVGSVLFFVTWMFYYDFADFISGCNMSNEGIARIMVFSLAFLLWPVVVIAYKGIGPISYYHMTKLPETLELKDSSWERWLSFRGYDSSQVDVNGEKGSNLKARWLRETASKKGKRIEEMAENANYAALEIFGVCWASLYIFKGALPDNKKRWKHPFRVGAMACMLIVPLLLLWYSVLLNNISLDLRGS